jgi:hypothetical protein
MKSKFNFSAFGASVIVGCIIVILFSWMSGRSFATALFPTMAMLSGFIITGFIIGIITKGVTILEPGLGAIVVALISYLVIPTINIKGFHGVWNSDWLIIMMNSIVLTFVGAWLGEKFQYGFVENSESTSPNIDWGWIIAGTFTGVTVTLILVNLLDLILGHNPTLFALPYFLAIFATGLVVGWKSPGITIKEAGLAGFLIITIDFDIIRLTLINETEIQLLYIIGGLVIGFIAAWLGGWVGEKIQNR